MDRKLTAVLGGSHFHFIPHHYGPFDRGIYELLENLSAKGLVEIIRTPALRWQSYRATQAGQEAGERILEQLSSDVSAYITKLSAFVRSISFAELISAVYSAYPEMKVNSVFQR